MMKLKKIPEIITVQMMRKMEILKKFWKKKEEKST
jgi:hypothetical protein